jgi:hypothetical protein
MVSNPFVKGKKKPPFYRRLVNQNQLNLREKFLIIFYEGLARVLHKGLLQPLP